MGRLVRGSLAAGAAGAFVVLLSPALLGTDEAGTIIAGVLPLGFLGAGAVAEVLRPGHPVALRMIVLGVLHIWALAGSVLALMLPDGQGLSTLLAALSACAFAVGFVALADVLVRFPSGEPRPGWAALVLRVGYPAAPVLALLAWLGSSDLVVVIDSESTATNPLHVPALGAVASFAFVVALLPLLGMVTLVSRYPGADPAEQMQLRWPIITAGVVVAGMFSTGLLGGLLGADVQTAAFVAAALALPASVLVGLARRSIEAERLAVVETSRARIVEAAALERKRLERDLHDGAQQQLIALLARVELARNRRADDPALREDLDQLRSGIVDAHQGLRELAQGLYPGVLSDHGLGEAVRAATARLPDGAVFEVDDRLEGRRFDERVEVAAYLVVLEGLTNAIKHAGTPAVQVRLHASDASLHVEVRDRGRGFDTSADPGGSGLVGLGDRLAALNGSLSVTSRPGAGTALLATLPAVASAG